MSPSNIRQRNKVIHDTFRARFNNPEVTKVSDIAEAHGFAEDSAYWTVTARNTLRDIIMELPEEQRDEFKKYYIGLVYDRKLTGRNSITGVYIKRKQPNRKEINKKDSK